MGELLLAFITSMLCGLITYQNTRTWMTVFLNLKYWVLIDQMGERRVIVSFLIIIFSSRTGKEIIANSLLNPTLAHHCTRDLNPKLGDFGAWGSN